MATALRVGPDVVRPSTSVRDVGIFIDADLSYTDATYASSADSFRALRCAASQHPEFSPGVCLSDAGHSAGTESPGLRERHPDRNSGFPVSSSPICAQRRCPIRRWSSALRPLTETLASLHWLCASERIQWRCWSSDRCMEWLRSI